MPTRKRLTAEALNSSGRRQCRRLAWALLRRRLAQTRTRQALQRRVHLADQLLAGAFADHFIERLTPRRNELNRGIGAHLELLHDRRLALRIDQYAHKAIGEADDRLIRERIGRKLIAPITRGSCEE